MDLTPWTALFEDAGEPHVALIYRDHAFLAEAVARWTVPALRAGGGAILVGTAAHTIAIRSALRKAGADVDGAERAGRLVFVDADWLMAHFMLDGSPDRAKFRELSTEIVRGVRSRIARPHSPVRAWGEMVSLLRVRGNPLAAQKLEEHWNEVISEYDFALLCSYEITETAPADADAYAKIARAHGEIILQPEIDLARPAATP